MGLGRWQVSSSEKEERRGIQVRNGFLVCTKGEECQKVLRKLQSLGEFDEWCKKKGSVGSGYLNGVWCVGA